MHTKELLRSYAGVIGYYVSVKSDSRRGLLLGPFTDESDAETWIGHARDAAHDIDSMAGFYEYGITRIQRPASRPLPHGKLNRKVGI